ncbi:YbjN domain-containing protein [Acidovorax sp. 22279]|uniref:YbjN domain-containing protein n=1 Tax=Acidovorax sp. 22279 TaxID=3453900 RepID=UPI003F84FC49
MTEALAIRDRLAEHLRSIRLVSLVENLNEDLTLELGEDGQRYSVYLMLLGDAAVFHVDLKLPVSVAGDSLFKVLNSINRQIPFGNFFVTKSNELAFKFYILSGSLDSVEDLSFCIYWIYDIVSTYKTALGVAISNIDNSYEMAEKLLDGIRDAFMSTTHDSNG